MHPTSRAALDHVADGRWASVWALAACGLLTLATAAAAQPEPYLGPCALVASADGKSLYLANAGARQVAWVDPVRQQVVRRIHVPARPTGLALSPDGSELYVTSAAPRSTVCVLEADSGRETGRMRAGHTAMGPAVTPDGRRLYVCNRFDGDVSVFDLSTGRETARVPAVREPVAAAVTPDGRSVLVANHLPADRADRYYVAAVVTVIDTRSHQTTAIRLPNGSNGVRDVCISPDGRHAYVTHVLSNYELVPSQVEQGWMNTNAISVLEVAGKRRINTVTLDEPYLGAANPWGVATTADGKWICVAHAGTHELSLIDAPTLLEKLQGLYTSPVAGGIPNDRGVPGGLQRRIRLSGNGPRELAIVGGRAYVAAYFSDSLHVVDLQRADRAQPHTIRLGPAPQPTLRRRGEILFHDALICYQHWQSCATCHPDARADALNWDLQNDGVGNPKNTKSMLLAHQTPPAMSEGVRASAEAAVRAGMEHILFAGWVEKEARAIDAYLKSLRPVLSPHLVEGRLSPAARRGKALFESDRVGCNTCHPPPRYTDLRRHDVGTRGPYDLGDRFDTPTLVETWRTAPYLHDGRYTAVKQLLRQGRHGAGHGRLEELSRQELDELVEFVLSL